MFVHLRTHTEFSVVDGTNRIDDLAQQAAKDQQAALAITDLSNVFGALKFYKACRSNGVKPLIGAEVLIEPYGATAPGAAPAFPASGPACAVFERVLLLVQNHAGYLSLCELLTRGWTRNVQRDQAVVKWAWLEELSTGLLALSGAQAGPVGAALMRGDAAKAGACALELGRIFHKRFYIEVQRAGRIDDEPHVHAAAQLAARLQLPLVATHPVQFPTEDDFESHEARVCISEGEMLANPKRVRRFTQAQYFKTQAEMRELFADLPSAVANTIEIAKRCSLTLLTGKNYLPEFPTPLVNGEKLSADDYFRHMSHTGLEDRLRALYPKEAQRNAQRPTYVARLEFEIATILKMGFPGYFLIVGDFISWAKSNGCPVGPGRGSGAGSLVAYSLKITDLDPLQYNLLFERFLNPDRVSMPDFDIDFCQANRDRVIDYVKQKYGKSAVSQIVTFGTMAARAAVRDAGRVLDMSYGFCDGITKLIPNKPGVHITIEKAKLEEPLLAQRERDEEDVQQLLAMAQKLEGLTRNVGMHAGGVLIAPGKLTDFCPLYQQPGSDSAVSQFDKDDVEAAGLVKFDFLGLATLTILEIAKNLIRRRHANRAEFCFEDLPLDDAKTYKLFADGKTEAVFQFESRGMQGMLRDAKPTRLEDLIAMNALYRPGPMDLIPSYIARKHGREAIDYPDPRLESILSETVGIMVYQEQVMQTAQIVGGYTLGGADLLRRAMGKKKKEEMDQQRDVFRAGALAHGLNQAKADEIFDVMEKFAGYGFNKSHAAAYALLAYHTAWVKVHYTAEFFCANMTVEMDHTDKLRVLVADALAMGVAFEAPDVNRGTQAFEPVTDRLIRYGLGAIKGTGAGAIEAIVAARAGRGGGSRGADVGPFKSLFDFCARIDRNKVNKRAIDALIRAGAFDTLTLNRAALQASVELAMNYADAQEANANQGGLFDMDDGHGSSATEPSLVSTLPWGVRERLTHEKAAIGFYLTGHLFDEVVQEVRRFVPTAMQDLLDSREPQTVAGVVSDMRIVTGQSGRKMYLFKLDDKTDTLDAVIDEALYNANRELIKDDEVVVLGATLQPDRMSGGYRLKVSQCWSLADARCRFGKFMRVRAGAQTPDIERLVREFPPEVEETDAGTVHRGVGVRVWVVRAGFQCELALDEGARFFPSDTALAAWMAQADQGEAQLVYG